MARREKTQSTGRFVLFDVLYEDGVIGSNGKTTGSSVTAEETGGDDAP
jgi:hypothetical protein